ncbi:hypothetical protein GWI33_006451 [Rhynchophorus ferrugineus]|uniref:Uncharacterized protein n=1 Tax=Rhynchophorus ferrugineus TaxID=354439 RepID=A0A834IHN8_RHYFE|nr:hypothetical protein GWI33_006451 [Rhynchophorus ferrugineus]
MDSTYPRGEKRIESGRSARGTGGLINDGKKDSARASWLVGTSPSVVRIIQLIKPGGIATNISPGLFSSRRKPFSMPFIYIQSRNKAMLIRYIATKTWFLLALGNIDWK